MSSWAFTGKLFSDLIFLSLEPVVEKSGGGDKPVGKKSTAADVEGTRATETESVRTAVIAETSETVVIEGVQDDDDEEEEEEIDDVEEIEEIDDVEPDDQVGDGTSRGLYYKTYRFPFLWKRIKITEKFVKQYYKTFSLKLRMSTLPLLQRLIFSLI